MFIYTFGSPRVGNEEFSNYFFSIIPSELYSRVTHYNDLVPHALSQLIGYKHVGNEVWF